MDKQTILAKENQNLREIIEVSKQITSGLDIGQIIKNVNYVISSKYNSDFTAFILPVDIDDLTPICYSYKGITGFQWEMGFPSMEPMMKFFENQEYNQLTFEHFTKTFNSSQIIENLSRYHPEFILPLKSDKGVIGIYLQGKKRGNEKYSVDDIQYCINIISFAAIAIENANLYRTATMDRMTKLFTHHQFKKRLGEEIARGLRYDTIFSLLLFDIDHFKKVNDTYGHLNGDIVIKDIAKIVRDSIREVDYGARYGGEEFAILLPGISITNAVVIGERLRQKVESHKFIGKDMAINSTISMGIAEYLKEYVKHSEDIILVADNALYHS
ncbi:MAG: GGDEF domain-containing protein, partial [Spirochaetes bacterium]|nr:GGDEF domain-containing protein [Spirochaetota bacterium]